MFQRNNIDECQELDRFVAALEDAYRDAGRVDLTAIAPDREHPQYFDVVRELVRVDVELRAARRNQVSLDFYQRIFPELFARRDDVEAIAFEDYRQRQQAGENPRADEYRARWKIDAHGWPEPADESPMLASTSASSLLNPEQSLVNSVGDTGRRRSGTRRDPSQGPEPPTTETLPRIGQTFLNFELIALLGRGAFARVYLAKQGELADRPVALKVSRRLGDESQTLAQLQHANIVPIYSVHRSGSFEAVCMPYYGGLTLADVLKQLREQRKQPTSGKSLADTVLSHHLNSTWHDTEVPVFAPDHAVVASDDRAKQKLVASNATCLQTLSGLSFVEAVLWIGARLADGLAHAHERSILHRDLKPANVLLANDGQPMLLDFNLSQDRKRTSSVKQAHIGGTLPYMSPESLRAFQTSMPGGDERSDLYSLGLVLYELLTGQYPFPIRHGEVEQVLVETLADRRQPIKSLRELNPAVTPAAEAIVLRCLQCDPKRRYASTRQLQEDLQRQLDHRPLRHTREPSLVERGRKWLRRHPRIASGSGVAAIAAAFVMLIGGALFARSERLTTLEARERLVSLEQVVQSAQVTFLDVINDRPGEQATLDATLQRAITTLDPSVDQHHRRELSGDETHRANTARFEALFLQAARFAQQAELETDEAKRATLLRSAEQVKQQAAELKSRDDATSPHDVGLHAMVLTAQRRFREARPHWERVTQADPQNVWAWYGLGHCYERLGEHALAAECYSACIALVPMQPQWHFRRGLAHLQRKLYEPARVDFAAVLRRDPQHTEARINHAIASLALKDSTTAIDDLSQAIAQGSDSARVYLMRAQARDQAGDKNGAKQDRELGFSRPPQDEHGWTARGVLRAATDPRAALADFDQALKLNPRFLAALESKAHVLSEQLADVLSAQAVLNEAIRWYPEESPTLAAMGVLLARQGKPGEAKKMAEQALAYDSSPSILYQVAGIYALLSREQVDERERAFSLLTSALRAGFGANLIDHDQDLAPLRTDPRFERLLDAVKTLHEPK